MTSITIEYPIEDARILVKAAFERAPDIKKYSENGTRRITGSTGFGMASYGEHIHVDLSENPSNPEETYLTASGEARVSFNITADPEKYVNQFMAELNDLRGRDVDDIVEMMSVEVEHVGSKEVAADGGTTAPAMGGASHLAGVRDSANAAVNIPFEAAGYAHLEGWQKWAIVVVMLFVFLAVL